MPVSCIICNKQLPAWFEGDMCGPACRKKKSRDRIEAPARAHRIGFEIDAIARTIGRGGIDKEDAESMVWVIYDRWLKLHDQVKQMKNEDAS